MKNSKPTGKIHAVKFDYVRLWDERAAIMEYDGLMPRQEAEEMAFSDTLSLFQQEHPEATPAILRDAIKWYQQHEGR